MAYSQRVERTFTVEQKGVGTPDFSGHVYKAVSIGGYVLNINEDETFLFNLLIATVVPGPYAFTVAPLAPGVVTNVDDAFSGLPGIDALAGEDYLIKMFWCSFNQPIRFRMTQAQVGGDVSCECNVPAFAHPAALNFDIGWARHQIESMDIASNTGITVENLGADLATGKVWLVGFRKPSIYRWF